MGTVNRIAATCDGCGRVTGDRAVITEDGYTFHRQPDGTWTDGDMTFNSLDEMQVGITPISPNEQGGSCPCAASMGRASSTATRVISGIGAGLRAAIKREAIWQSTLRDNYDNDFGQWLEYSDMYGLAGHLGFENAEEAWEVNPTIQGSTDPLDFKVVPEGEQMDMELSASLSWTCESCGSDMCSDEPCDCARRAEARQPELMRAVRAARESLDMGDLVISESAPSIGGMDIHRKVGGDFEAVYNRIASQFSEGRGLKREGHLPERARDGEWITNAAKAARRIATADGYFVGEVFMPDMRTDPRREQDMGSVVIGGDKGDVWATSAYADERHGVAGVTLTDVEFRTTLDLDNLATDDILGEVMQVISESYDSIQEDTFAPTKTN